MKKQFLLAFFALSACTFSSSNLQAQDTTTVGEDLKNAGRKTGRAVGKGARKVGNKTAEIASKGKSEVVDQAYAGKEGPNGERIFIDRRSKYYYVDDKGHKKYVKLRKLRDKQ
jgi:hypothetical protein